MFINSDQVTIIGTGDGEKCIGIEDVKDLLRIDLEYWGNFILNIDEAIITEHGDVACVICDGVLSKEINGEKIYSNTINKVSEVLEGTDSYEEKLLKALKSISYSLHETKTGDEICRPVRFSGVLVEEGEIWKFSHIHYSYPVAPPIDIKILRK